MNLYQILFLIENQKIFRGIDLDRFNESSNKKINMSNNI